jgi:hypothetical protein
MALLYNSTQLYNTSSYTYNGIALIIGESRTILYGVLKDLSSLDSDMSDTTAITGTISDYASLTSTLEDQTSITGTVSDFISLSGTISDFSAIIVSL